MIKISDLYPSGEGNIFDMKYYLAKHIPLVRRLSGAALKKVEVEEGMGGLAAGSPPAYLAMGHLFFESVQTFQAAFEPHVAAITGDIPNYTNTKPTIQISEVKL
ncbi:MAG TPA: EthD family reductase [Candidatus Acidoferrales bacterium]|jgi:uncharacterized protein (TIGR02118 family)|nr:EthD family reductase [Candidatus Acidoferrales bacterium]